MATQDIKNTMRLRYRLRPPGAGTNPDRLRTLYIRLKVNGSTAPDYATGIQVAARHWNQVSQCVTGSSEESRLLNNQLQHVRNQHAALFESLLRAGKVPTARSIKDAWTMPVVPIPLLLQAATAYVSHLKGLRKTNEAIAPATLRRIIGGFRYLKKFIHAHHQKAKDVPLDVVTIRWAKEYNTYLCGQVRPNGKPVRAPNSAIRYVMHLRPLFDYLIEQEQVTVNPLTTLRLKREPGKAVTFLEDIHLQRLADLPLLEPLALVRDVVMMLCYTGLDLKDLRRFLKHPDHYIATTMSGEKKIVIDRGKTASDCHIPILPGVLDVIKRNTGSRLPSEQHINRMLKVFQASIGFPHTLTAKICRKTAGTLFLNAGFSLEVVSKILGHNSTKTTERYYTRITSKRVDQEMVRVGTVIVPLPVRPGHNQQQVV